MVSGILKLRWPKKAASVCVFMLSPEMVGKKVLIEHSVRWLVMAHPLDGSIERALAAHHKAQCSGSWTTAS
jgi:hypothetical protein